MADHPYVPMLPSENEKSPAPLIKGRSWEPLLTSLLFFAFSFILTDVVSGICMWRMPKPSPGWPPLPNQSHPVLPDLGFLILPYSDMANLPTNILLVLMLATILFIFSGGQKGSSKLILCTPSPLLNQNNNNFFLIFQHTLTLHSRSIFCH